MNDLEARWQRLFEGLWKVEDSDNELSERETGAIGNLLGRVGLIQPFGSMDWIEARGRPVTLDDMPNLSLFDCVRTITMIRRGDRFSEGLVEGSIRSGGVRALCERAHFLAGGIRIPKLPEIHEKM